MDIDASAVIRALLPLIDVLEQLEISYYVGGSIASSAYGVSRPTQDVDVVADIQLRHVALLVRLLSSAYYVDADMIKDAIYRRASFNIIDLESMFKIDIFIPKAHQFAKQERLRVRKMEIVEGTRSFYFASPEDTILNKLEWYSMGDGISQRQWNDILGVLKIQGPNLDMAYLYHWASVLDVAKLLERAIGDAGLEDR